MRSVVRRAVTVRSFGSEPVHLLAGTPALAAAPGGCA